jgi:outer membrane receptor protein involved in Fe transport
MKTNFQSLLSPVAMGLLLFCNHAFGQSDTVNFERLSLTDLLKVKITTASKTSLEIEKVPATVVIITKEQIKMRGYRSLLDVLYDLPDMKVDDKAYSISRSSTVFRGIQGQEKILLLLDGIRVSSPSGDVNPIMENYPVNNADHIEVVYGPASALYGADAVAGIINIISKKSPDKGKLTVDASSMIGTYGYTNNSIFIADKISKDVSLILSGQYAYDRTPDYSKLYKEDSLLSMQSNATGSFNSVYGPMTPVEPVKPGYSEPMRAFNIYASLQAKDFSFTLFRNYARTPTSMENNTNNAVYNSDVYLGQYIEMASGAYKKTLGSVKLSSTLSASRYYMDPKSNYRNVYTGMERAYKYVNNLMVKAEQQVDWKINRDINLTTGISYQQHHSTPWSADLENPVENGGYIHGSYLGTKSYYKPGGLPAVFYTSTYNNIGNYLQLQYAPVKMLSFTLGARYDINSRYGNNFTPRMGMVYKPAANTIAKLLYGRAFLAPNTSDFYAQWGSFVTNDSGRTYESYYLHLPNTNLKPITSGIWELNVSHFLSEKMGITFDAYTSVTSGLHAFADDSKTTHIYNNRFNDIPVGYVEVYINKGQQTTYGGSLSLNYKNTVGKVHFNSYAALSYVNGFVKGQEHSVVKNEIDFISPFMLRMGFDLKSGKFSVAPRLIITGRQNLTGTADTVGTLVKRQTISGYQLLNVSLRYNITRKIGAFVNATNALNQKYKGVGFNMDLKKEPTEFYYGQHEDPMRLFFGVNFNL